MAFTAWVDCVTELVATKHTLAEAQEDGDKGGE
jgi:hypothetical protein